VTRALGIAIIISVAALGCRGTPPADFRSDSNTQSIASMDFDPLPRDPLGLDAARHAHHRAEIRRRLRFVDAIEPGSVLRATVHAVDAARIARGEVGVDELYEVGRVLFEHEFSRVDGLGSALDDDDDENAPHRSPFRRVHAGRSGGPETNGCASCHWRGGAAGAGSLQDNSFFFGDGDHVDSADARNPPPLHGAGVVEALAREMSAELQSARSRLLESASRRGEATSVELVAKGVRFGVLRARADGSLDTSSVEGVDADLVIKPFGWKGTFATLREFASESLAVHFGVETEDLVAARREHPGERPVEHGEHPGERPAARREHPGEHPGEHGELRAGQLTALVAYLAMLELPIVRPPPTVHDMAPAAANLAAPTATVFTDDWARGRRLFDEIGCANCHRPHLVLESPILSIRSDDGDHAIEIDLSRQGETPRIEYDARAGGYPVWLFSDLKRHDLGAGNASLSFDRGVAPAHYLTRRLWGLAGSPPYFHDGEKPSFDDAIEAHDGEASDARKAYRALGFEQKGAVRVFLLSLARTRRLIVP